MQILDHITNICIYIYPRTIIINSYIMLIDELYLSHLCPAIKTKEGVGRFSRHFEAAVIERQSSVLHGGPRDTARKLRQQIEQHWSVRPVREGL